MTTPSAPGYALSTALGRSEPLTSLMQRVRESKARYEHIAPLLPAGLQAGTRPGPLDETAWVLLVAHASAAAKVRQLLPTLEAALVARGWVGPPIRIKILTPP